MASANVHPKSVIEYFEDLTTEEKITLGRLRRTIKKACPEAEEVISYGMPAYKYHGMLAWFTAHENHCGLYVRPRSMKALEKELKPYRSSKSSIRFTVENPLPDKLVTRLVKESMRVNLEREGTKKEKQRAGKTRKN